MANPFGLQEVTLNQLGDSTHAINAIDETGALAASPRKSVYQPFVVIVTDHEDTKNSLTGWPDGGAAPTSTALNAAYLADGIALFSSMRHGEPFKKDNGTLKHILHRADSTPNVPTDVTTLFPNFDYSTFE